MMSLRLGRRYQTIPAFLDHFYIAAGIEKNLGYIHSVLSLHGPIYMLSPGLAAVVASHRAKIAPGMLISVLGKTQLLEHSIFS